jgi:hypothetical protein
VLLFGHFSSPVVLDLAIYLSASCAHHERQYCAGTSPDSILLLARVLVSEFFFVANVFRFYFLIRAS